MAERSAARGAAREILDVVTPIVTDGIEKPRSAKYLSAALQDSGVWRMLQPIPYRGLAVAADEFISAVAALAALDGSVGWLSAMFNGAAYEIAGQPQRAAEEIWSSDATSLVVACYRPEGQLVRTGRDRRLTGRWQFVAGGAVADWLLVAAAEDGARYRVLVPRGDVQVEPVRNQSGLIAAGICDVTAVDLPVAEQRIFDATDDVRELPTPVVIGAGAAAAVAGSADGMWRTLVDQVRERLAASCGSEEVADRPSSTATVARAASDIDAARLQIAGSIRPDVGVDIAWSAAWAQRQAASRARDAVDQLLGSTRRHALDASDPVTRLWQDVHACFRLTTHLLDGFDLR